jgi:hypothetical protein
LFPCILSAVYCILLGTACSTRPPITADLVTASLTDAKTGKVRAGELGWATITELRIETTETEGNKTKVVARIKAEQDKLGVNYKLSARLRLYYEWENRAWALKRVEEEVPWAAKGPREPRPYTQEMEPGGDSGAIQGLLRARKLARRGLNAIP